MSEANEVDVENAFLPAVRYCFYLLRSTIKASLRDLNNCVTLNEPHAGLRQHKSLRELRASELQCQVK
jgi:hypothetical protein